MKNVRLSRALAFEASKQSSGLKHHAPKWLVKEINKKASDRYKKSGTRKITDDLKASIVADIENGFSVAATARKHYLTISQVENILRVCNK